MNKNTMNNKSYQGNDQGGIVGRWIMLLIGITAAVVIGILLLSCSRNSEDTPLVNLLTTNGAHIRIR